jgi:hypothetical protein
MPQTNWPMAVTPLAGTGIRFGLYLKEMWSQGRPTGVALDLNPNPQPSHLSFAGYSAPQLGHTAAPRGKWS